MHLFKAILKPGSKTPYAAWTFLIVPAKVAKGWGAGPKAVCGTIAGIPFRGTATRGEGLLRIPIPRDLREKVGVRNGDRVEVTLDLDTKPRAVELPAELRAVLRREPAVAALYEELPPAHRRAWAAYVADAKRPETRLRRADAAPKGIRARAFPR